MVSYLQQFIGNDLLFAHNARFDIEWLTYHGLKLGGNLVWDTFMLATVAWPSSESYNLGMLAASLSLPIGDEHRAAADVAVTWQLLQKIRENLNCVPEDLARVTSVLEKSNGAHYLPLFRERQGENQTVNTGSDQESKLSALPDGKRDAQAILGPSGIFERQLPGFTCRPGQLEMAQAVAQWVAQQQVGIIEAGTGTGKTYAYLCGVLPALEQGKRVVIATYTRHLQDQLVTQDIPRFMATLGLVLRAVPLKGRRNYICHSRLTQALARASMSLTEAFVLIKIIRWLSSGGSGDIEHLNTSHQADMLLRQLHADAISCRRQCTKENLCPYVRAKRAATTASLVVINHALLAQAAFGEEESIRDAVVVVDEAHHLEEAVRNATALDLTPQRIAETLAPLLAVAAQQRESQPSHHLVDECEALVAEYTAWLAQVAATLQAHTTKDRLLITPMVRRGSHWQRLAHAASSWRGRLKFILGLSKSLTGKTEHAYQLLRDAVRGIERLAIEFESFVEGSAERIQWIEVRPDMRPDKPPRVYLHDVALSVAPILQDFFASLPAAVITSATLTVRGSFSFCQTRLGLTEAAARIVPAPFNYKDSMLLYLADDSPNPGELNFDSYTKRIFTEVSILCQGRVLGLFSSQRSVKNIYNMIINDLNKEKIKLYAQKITGGRHNILHRFKNMHRSVLLGTLSFWEGVDVPGESLSVVIIPKLPFPSPDDPILAAIAAHEGLNVFTDLFVPRMILQLRQGVGRLIRSSDDRGVVVILDSRLHQYEYGQAVMASLPPATFHIGSHRDLARVIKKWIGEETLTRWSQDQA